MTASAQLRYMDLMYFEGSVWLLSEANYDAVIC